MPSNSPSRDRRAVSGAKPSAGRSATSAGLRASAAAKSDARKPVPAGRPGTRGPSGGPPRPSGKPNPKSKSRSKSRSIVSQPRRPWGLIGAVIAVIVFAALVIGFAVLKLNKHHVNAQDAKYVRAEIPAAKAIAGVKYKAEINHVHVTSPVKYDTTPPTGGNHSQVWADCTGTVYPNPIANENAVHPLEHGAVWITYRPGLAAADVATLAKLVTGQNGTLMSPYPGLSSPISLQAWDYQLFVDKATDPRIAAFITALRLNPGTTPEFGASCAYPSFKANPSTFGHPVYQ